VLKLTGGSRADLMATDPPYLVDYHGGNHPRSMTNHEAVKNKHHADYCEQEHPEFFKDFIRIALRHCLSERPAIYQWHAYRRQALVEQAWTECGLLVHQQIIWFKGRAVLTHSHFMWQHEPCFYGWPNGKQPSRKPPTNASTVWNVDQKGLEGIHPTEKPITLFSNPMLWHLLEGGLCYESFSGSGTSLTAAQLTGRTCYAMEIAPAFVAVALERLSDMGLKPKLVSSVRTPNKTPNHNGELKRKSGEPKTTVEFLSFKKGRDAGGPCIVTDGQTYSDRVCRSR
jgi:DNA modification methylase